MKTNKLLFLVFVMLFQLSFFESYAKEKITWLRSDFPPLSITTGKFSEKGTCDLVTNLLISKLKNYDFNIKLSNYKRTLFELKNQQKVGSVALLKNPDREKYIHFSIPYLVVLPNGITILKSQFHKFKPFLNKKGFLSFEKLLTESALTVGISSGRTYSGIIDKTLKKYKNHINIYVNYDITLLEPLLTMMQNKRLDYILCYPNEATYYLKKSEGTSDIIWLPIEGMEKHSLGYVGFPKNQWGKNIINQVNQILIKHRNTPEFHKFYEFWLDDASMKKYREYVNDFYKKN